MWCYYKYSYKKKLLCEIIHKYYTYTICVYIYIYYIYTYVSVIQSLSCIWLYATSWTASHQASLSLTISQSLFKLVSIESVMPSNHPILCSPLLLLPSIFPSIRVFSWWVSSLNQVGKVLEIHTHTLVSAPSSWQGVPNMLLISEVLTALGASFCSNLWSFPGSWQRAPKSLGISWSIVMPFYSN